MNFIRTTSARSRVCQPWLHNWLPLVSCLLVLLAVSVSCDTSGGHNHGHDHGHEHAHAPQGGHEHGHAHHHQQQNPHHHPQPQGHGGYRRPRPHHPPRHYRRRPSAKKRLIDRLLDFPKGVLIGIRRIKGAFIALKGGWVHGQAYYANSPKLRSVGDRIIKFAKLVAGPGPYGPKAPFKRR
ncbi:uncharacterized protein LOC131891637 [Tigriopus californicus]|uniref:uncharacterized protein LOC131891637 n=1 Tax=Tigriopus californicus TaxID=6832 RepID=UPI0027DA6B38|nr:uncharacterized protein LOC131891637 [Tigriopus californicus]